MIAGLAAGCAGAPETSPADMKVTFNAGLTAYDAGDYRTAYKTWSSIEDVDLAALRNVAVMLRTGKGVEKDPKTAQALMERAAQAGLMTAQADLADMLIKGEAGPPDPKAALPWLILASEQGHPMARYELAGLFEEGKVVPQDLNAARKLYEAAAQGGVTEAKARLDSLGPAPATVAPVATAPSPDPKH